MPDAASTPSRFRCPHCGKPPGLRWTQFLPSNTRNREFTCRACGNAYDTSDACRMAGMMGALLGMGLSILLFGRIVKAGHGATPSVVAATAVVIAGFALGSVIVTWISFKLVRK